MTHAGGLSNMPPAGFMGDCLDSLPGSVDTACAVPPAGIQSPASTSRCMTAAAQHQLSEKLQPDCS